jgi:hypothetical protein
MIVTKKLIVLPANLVPGIEVGFSNKTSEMVSYCLNIIENGIDPKVEAIIKDPERIAYTHPDYKSFLSTDCKLVTTDAQKKNTNISIITRTACNPIKTTTVRNMLNINAALPKEIKNMLNEALMFDLIDLEDSIYIPQQQWNKSPGWLGNFKHTDIDMFYNAYVAKPNEIIIDLESAMYYSNNATLTEENFIRLKMMLENNQDVNLAVGMMNNINPTKSFVELLVLHNYIPVVYRNKNKKKILKALYSIYTIPYIETDISLSNIEIFSKMNGFELSLDKQEFIADNYVNSNIETSSMFNLKIKIKS